MTPFWDPNFTPPCGQLAAPYLYAHREPGPNSKLYTQIEVLGPRKLCVKHQKSFWAASEGWVKSDSWVILQKSQKIALVELKRDENIFWKPALSSLQWRFRCCHLRQCRRVTRKMV